METHDFFLYLPGILLTARVFAELRPACRLPRSVENNRPGIEILLRNR